MKLKRTAQATLLMVTAAGFLTGGCGQQADMTAKEAADFKGGPHQPMSEAKKKDMQDFMENFRKLHPEQGGGAPPAATK